MGRALYGRISNEEERDAVFGDGDVGVWPITRVGYRKVGQLKLNFHYLQFIVE